MKDHNDLLPDTIAIIENDLDRLKNQDWIKKTSPFDAQLNYLYFLRDEIYSRIIKTNKDRDHAASQ